MTVTPTYGARIETFTQIDVLLWRVGRKTGPAAGRALGLRTTSAQASCPVGLEVIVH
jgi:hypothetical protein